MQYFGEALNNMQKITNDFSSNVQDEVGESITNGVLLEMIQIIGELVEFEDTELLAFNTDYEIKMEAIKMLEPIC